jgi:exosortase A-associated hydrolase 1
MASDPLWQEYPLPISHTREDGVSAPMLGILSLPPAQQVASATAVLIVVGGAQYRAGSHRQFVLLARHLAGAGFPVLRFDLPGMGDSPGQPLPFEDSSPCIAAAIDTLLAQPGIRRVVLWGLCDGASASLLYGQATNDARVHGLALLNPWLSSEDGLVRAQLRHYYPQRLTQLSFWGKLLRGQVGWSAVRAFGRSLGQVAQGPAASSAQQLETQQAPYQDRMAEGWKHFRGPILLLMSGRDLTAQAFIEHTRLSPAWSGWSERSGRVGTTVHTLAAADHTCSDPVSARRLEALVTTWLQSVD